MKNDRIAKKGLFLLLAMCLAAGGAMADVADYEDITIWDQTGHRDGVVHTYETWAPAANSDPWEDNEVEPLCYTGDEWDLEGIFLGTDAPTLTMVGTWDFFNGASSNGEHFDSGDIFIAVGEEPQFGEGTGAGSQMHNDYGYDYVMDVDWESANPTFDVYSAFGDDGATDVDTVFYSSNNEANPWRRDSGGTLLAEDQEFDAVAGDVTNSGFQVEEGASENHDMRSSVTFDLSWLDAKGSEVWFHFTQECGNDNLMGNKGSNDPGAVNPNPVPEPASVGLLGLGVAGLLVARLRRKSY